MSNIYQKNSFKILIFLANYFFIGCAAVGSVLVPLESISPPSGKYSIGTQVYFWTDNNRSEVYTTNPEDFRELMVQVWYPAEKREGYQYAPHVTFPVKSMSTIAKTAGLPTNFGKHGTLLKANSVFGLLPVENKKFPLILFSHGDGGLLNQNTSQIEELVSHGYIVIACNHTYNSSITFDKDGNALIYQQNIDWNEQAQHHKKYYTNQLIKYRYQDLVFMMNELKKKRLQGNKKNPFFNIIDFYNIGAMGHSMGGGTTYLSLIKNKDIKAGVAFDGWFFGLLEKDFLIKNPKPFLHIGQEQFIDQNIYGDINNSLEGKENFKIYNKIMNNNENKHAAYIKNSLHYTYTDIKLIYNTDAPFALPLDSVGKVDKKIVNYVMDKSVLSFFNYALKNQELNLKELKDFNNQVVYFSKK